MINNNTLTPDEKYYEKKRQEYKVRFNNLLEEILNNARSTKDIADGFNRIFDMIQRLIKYSPQEKLGEKAQSKIFTDISNFINQIDENHNFPYVFNTFPKTSIKDYCNKTVWEQFSQLAWLKNQDNDLMPEWWSCSYRTLMLYNILSKLKEAWLDLEIKFFRAKNKDKGINQLDEMWHSWLVVNFKGKDYLVDWGEHNCIIKNVNNFQNNDIIFLDSLEDFQDNLSKFTIHKKIAFWLYWGLDMKSDWWQENIKTYIDFSFIEWWFEIVVANELYTFYLDTSKIFIKFDNNWYNFYYNHDNYFEHLKSPSEFRMALTLASVGNEDARKIKPEENKLLDYVLPIIFQRSHIDNIDFFPYTWTYIHDVEQRVRKNNYFGSYIPYLDSFKLAKCF